MAFKKTPQTQSAKALSTTTCIPQFVLTQGLSPTEVIEGYEVACKKTLEILPELCCGKLKDVNDVDDVARAIKSAVMSKQYGNEEFFAKLIAQACGKLEQTTGRKLYLKNQSSWKNRREKCIQFK